MRAALERKEREIGDAETYTELEKLVRSHVGAFG
jgi:hypothetical protein